MFQNISTIRIRSEDYKQLAAWYKDVFNLKETERINNPYDTGALYEFSEGQRLPDPLAKRVTDILIPCRLSEKSNL